jgi:hypothetical protein
MITKRYFVANGIPQVEELHWVGKVIAGAQNVLAASADNNSTPYYDREIVLQGVTKVSAAALNGEKPPAWWEKLQKAYELTQAEAKAEAAKPKSVTMRQARLALLEAGLLDNVQDIIAGMQGSNGAAARIEWEYSSNMVRSQPLITAMAAALKLTDADVDALFLSASTK